MPSAKTLLDDYASARNAILDHCGIPGDALSALEITDWSDVEWRIVGNRLRTKHESIGSRIRNGYFEPDSPFRGESLSIVFLDGDESADYGVILLNENEVK